MFPTPLPTRYVLCSLTFHPVCARVSTYSCVVCVPWLISKPLDKMKPLLCTYLLLCTDKCAHTHRSSVPSPNKRQRTGCPHATQHEAHPRSLARSLSPSIPLSLHPSLSLSIHPSLSPSIPLSIHP
eukprot:scpid106864/ scgid4009/ 